MKDILNGIVGLFLITFHLSAQDCELPEVYDSTNTGANMTLMLTETFIQSLPILEENAYVVAISLSGQVFGSTYVNNVDQNSISVWGDDSFTENVVDGALSDELVNLQLISGDDLYQIVTSSSINYETNSPYYAY